MKCLPRYCFVCKQAVYWPETGWAVTEAAKVEKLAISGDALPGMCEVCLNVSVRGIEKEVVEAALFERALKERSFKTQKLQ